MKTGLWKLLGVVMVSVTRGVYSRWSSLVLGCRSRCRDGYAMYDKSTNISHVFDECDVTLHVDSNQYVAL